MSYVDPSKMAAEMLSKLGLTGTNMDLTFMDGPDYPSVSPDDIEIGTLTPTEMMIAKMMVDSGAQAAQAKQRMMGELIVRVGQAMAQGKANVVDTSKMAGLAGISGVMQAVGMNTDALGRPPKDLNALMDRATTTNEMANQMLYHSIKTRLDRWGDGAVGIRRGGKIVTTDKEWEKSE